MAHMAATFGQIDDLFALQDEIAAQILSALEVKIAPGDRARLGRDHVASIEAYDAFLRGLDHYGRHSLDDTQLAIDHYEQAIALDPGFARAYAGLAMVYVRDAVEGWDLTVEDALAKAAALTEQALRLDRSVPQVYFAQGLIDLYHRDYAAAVRNAERALAINPSYADAHALLAWTLHFAGRPDEGLASLERAVRLNPRVPATAVRAFSWCGCGWRPPTPRRDAATTRLGRFRRSWRWTLTSPSPKPSEPFRSGIRFTGSACSRT